MYKLFMRSRMDGKHCQAGSQKNIYSRVDSTYSNATSAAPMQRCRATTVTTEFQKNLCAVKILRTTNKVGHKNVRDNVRTSLRIRDLEKLDSFVTCYQQHHKSTVQRPITNQQHTAHVSIVEAQSMIDGY
jgi:hypothetical protein